jgi:hypothetical protein
MVLCRFVFSFFEEEVILKYGDSDGVAEDEIPYLKNDGRTQKNVWGGYGAETDTGRIFCVRSCSMRRGESGTRDGGRSRGITEQDATIAASPVNPDICGERKSDRPLGRCSPAGSTIRSRRDSAFRVAKTSHSERRSILTRSGVEWEGVALGKTFYSHTVRSRVGRRRTPTSVIFSHGRE